MRILIIIILFFQVGFVFALDCKVLQKRIYENIQSKGVKNFRLQVVRVDTEVTGKVVGTCNGGRANIVYIRQSVEQEKQAKPRPWHDALAGKAEQRIQYIPGFSPTEEDKQQASQEPDVGFLIYTLHTTRNTELYYNSSTWPKNLKKLEELARDHNRDITPYLVVAYNNDKSDDLFRFNVVILLNRALQVHANFQPQPEIVDRIAETLLKAMQDNDPWVRTEAVWGLQFTHDPKYAAEAQKLINDTDVNVAKEANTTYEFLNQINR